MGGISPRGESILSRQMKPSSNVLSVFTLLAACVSRLLCYRLHLAGVKASVAGAYLSFIKQPSHLRSHRDKAAPIYRSDLSLILNCVRERGRGGGLRSPLDRSCVGLLAASPLKSPLIPVGLETVFSDCFLLWVFN